MIFLFTQYPAHRLAMIYVIISTWLIMAAFFLQTFWGLIPCELCLWQRIPHYIVMFGAVLVPLKYVRTTLFLQMFAYLGNALLALYHGGIERKLWQGLEGCSSLNIKNVALDDLYQKLIMTRVTKCDQITFDILGLSLSNLNMLVCFGLFLSLVYAIWGYDAHAKK